MGTAERRQREAAQRRKSILDAARKVFWKRGYVGATMPQIAELAELAPGTLYLYFPGKDALYVELLREGYDLLLTRLAGQAHEHADPFDRAAALIDAFFGFARQYPEYFDIMFFVLQRDSAGTWEGNFPAGQVEQLRAQEDKCKRVAADALEAVHFDAGGQRASVINAIWGMLAGVVFYFRNDEDFDAVASQAKRLILASIFPGRGDPRPSRI
jgi:AcrR family transcriptional regulator